MHYDAKSMPRIETELFALVLFLQFVYKLLLCYSLFISTCCKIILISWLCIPARPCTSITWNLTPQEEVVIMAERLILDLNQAESSHAQNLYMVLMLFPSSRQAFPVISDMLCGHYLNLSDGKHMCGDGGQIWYFLYCRANSELFHICLNMGLFIKCIVSFRDIGVVQWVNHMKTLYLHGWSLLMIYSCHQSLCTSLKRETAVEIRSLQINLSSCAKILRFEVDL